MSEGQPNLLQAVLEMRRWQREYFRLTRIQGVDKADKQRALTQSKKWEAYVDILIDHANSGQQSLLESEETS